MSHRDRRGATGPVVPAPTRLPVAAPAQVLGLDGAQRVAAAEAHTCAIAAGKVLCWGSGATGRLGVGGTARIEAAQLVALP